MKAAFRACAIGATVALVALSACDTIYSTAPGAANGEGGTANSDAASATADGAAATMDGASAASDGGITNMTVDGGTTDGAAPALGNLDCAVLKKSASVLFCADFEGSFPYGFSSAQNNASITQTTGVPNGTSSKVLDIQLGSGVDAGTTLLDLSQQITRPATGSVQIDADIKVVGFGFSYAAIVGFTNVGSAFVGAPGLAVDVPLGQSSLAFTIMGESGKSFTKADTAWHHLVVSLAPTGTFSVTVDAIGVQSAGSSAPPDVLDLTVGLFDVSAGTASAPTDVQIDNVLVRSL